MRTQIQKRGKAACPLFFFFEERVQKKGAGENNKKKKGERCVSLFLGSTLLWEGLELMIVRRCALRVCAVLCLLYCARGGTFPPVITKHRKTTAALEHGSAVSSSQKKEVPYGNVRRSFRFRENSDSENHPKYFIFRDRRIEKIVIRPG